MRALLMSSGIAPTRVCVVFVGEFGCGFLSFGAYQRGPDGPATHQIFASSWPATYDPVRCAARERDVPPLRSRSNRHCRVDVAVVQGGLTLHG